MDFWSNISTFPQDPEIIRINHLEANLGELPDKVRKIRELITRHEVCHFKFREHIRKIRDSILNLHPAADPDKIGLKHIRHGDSSWEKDTTGRSLLGQQYLWALKRWMNEFPSDKIPERYDEKLGRKIQTWLGIRKPDKIRLVRLLIARMTWDWKSCEELKQGGEFENLELQACATDICHYAFPENLDQLLQGIGQLKPLEKLEGCGSFNDNIREYVENELLTLNDSLQSLLLTKNHDKDHLIRIWLFACLIKTLKEQVGFKLPEIKLSFPK